MAATAGAELKTGASSGSPNGQGAEPFSAALPEHEQGAGLEVKRPGLKAVPKREVGATGRG